CLKEEEPEGEGEEEEEEDEEEGEEREGVGEEEQALQECGHTRVGLCRGRWLSRQNGVQG
ncbi:hypothetical protein, partial [Klebsiella quasipneumoniae]|uniref:hypothetical protein n=1 Tax=Klebsiella quasipneumoniae TaxID=1463165 RepID=UPI0027301B09